MFAPVVIFTYKRLDSLRNLLISLEANEEAPQTDLYFFADLNEDQKDEKKVQDVRNYLSDYANCNNCFKNVCVYAAEKHMGLAESVISGVTKIIEKYGKVIVIEDDLITSKNFLKYMNQCLDYYENDRRIWSINGYSPDIPEKNRYEKPVYLDYRASSWG